LTIWPVWGNWASVSANRDQGGLAILWACEDVIMINADGVFPNGLLSEICNDPDLKGVALSFGIE
jgi:hypothetical protein